MLDDRSYGSNLEEFVCKTIERWKKDKDAILTKKLQKNYEAVTNRDFRERKWKSGEGEAWRARTWIGFIRVKAWSFYAVFLDTVLKNGEIPIILTPSPYDETYMPPEMLKIRDKRIENMHAKMKEQHQMRNADRVKMKQIMSLAWYGMTFGAFDIEDVESVEFKLTMPPEVLSAVQSGYMSPEEAFQYGRYEKLQQINKVPGHRYVSVHSMVWDMDTDDFNNPARCAGYAEMEKTCPYDLRMVENDTGYIKSRIDDVVDSASTRQAANDHKDPESPGKAALTDRQKNINRYYFYMRAPREFALEFERTTQYGDQQIATLKNTQETIDIEKSGYEMEIMGEIADNKIIRYIRNESGKRPHKMCVLEMNLDESTGSGIADNMADCQEALIGMINAFQDNKKLSANVMVAVKKRFLAKPGQEKQFKPGTEVEISDSCDDVRKAIVPILIPDAGESLISGINLMLQLKDDVSMIPTILQGFTLAKHQPDTAYELQQLTANAGKYIGQGIRNFDEQLIEPENQEQYEYNMLYGEDEQCRVNCKVKANGFQSFINKEIRGSRMQQALNMFMANEYIMPYIKLKPHLEIIYGAMDEDPMRFIKDDEERARDSKNELEARSQAQADAIKMAQAQMGIEVKKDVTVKGAEHQFKMAEEDQKHDHRLIEDGVKLKVGMQKDSRGGSRQWQNP